MGHFVDLLKKRYAVELDDSIDVDAVLGLDVKIKRPIKTRDALAAVALDQAGFDIEEGNVVCLIADKLASKHLYRFLRDIAFPETSCNADGVERCANGTILVHAGKLETTRWGSSEWWSDAFQRGLACVIIVENMEDIGKEYIPFVDRTHDLRGVFDDSAYEVVSLVLGIDVAEIPQNINLELAQWPHLYSSVRPGASVDLVIDRIEKLVGIDAGSFASTEHISQPADRVVTRLRDLTGFGAAKEWGMRLATDLKAYACGCLDWADVDKGILLEGAPGTGKTFFVGALAAEAGVEMIAINYADWAGGDKGGDSVSGNLKKMFAEWRKKSESGPVIVFVDELDSLGKRGGNAHNESWFGPQINAWLAFLDGAVSREGIVVIGATNYIDRIDPALLRPGRLERTVNIPLPSLSEYPGIIRHHLPSDADLTNMAVAARACRGRSPADVSLACREARRAARHAGRVVTALDVASAVEASRMKWSQADDRLIAVHEAGHAVMSVLTGLGLDHVDADSMISMTDEKAFHSKEDVDAVILVSLAGIAAEEEILGAHCNGGTADLENATTLVRKAMTQFGFGQRKAFVAEHEYRLRRELVDAVEARVDEMYGRACTIVRDAKPIIKRVADRLQKDRYLSGDEVRRIMIGKSLLQRKHVEPVWSAPDDNERGNPRNQSRIRFAA